MGVDETNEQFDFEKKKNKKNKNFTKKLTIVRRT